MLKGEAPDPFESETQIFSANDDPLSYGGLQVNLLRQACSVDLTAPHPEVAHHPDPVEALAAFNAYAAGSRSIRFAAPDHSDAAGDNSRPDTAAQQEEEKYWDDYH